MRKYKALFVIGLAFGLSRSAFATCTGGGDPCNAPRNGSITAHTATTLNESVQNAATPNTTDSVYFFEATTLGSAQDVGTPDSRAIIVLTEDFSSPATGNNIIADTVKPLLGQYILHGL